MTRGASVLLLRRRISGKIEAEVLLAASADDFNALCEDSRLAVGGLFGVDHALQGEVMNSFLCAVGAVVIVAVDVGGDAGVILEEGYECPVVPEVVAAAEGVDRMVGVENDGFAVGGGHLELSFDPGELFLADCPVVFRKISAEFLVDFARFFVAFGSLRIGVETDVVAVENEEAPLAHAEVVVA